jgi:alpha-ketoglutarate-dependent 2,4-dichlorophenoxyacetate dioxygenase
MALTFRRLHRHFVAEVSPIELRNVHDPQTLAAIRAGMDEYAVLVFHDQAFSDAEQIAFAERLDGRLHQRTGSRVIATSRFGNEALSDISNLDEHGDILKAGDRRREFTDMRAAYDALPDETKTRLEGLRTHHSITHSRQVLGFEFSAAEQEQLKGAVHPLVRTIPRSHRRSLYLASHASRIVDWPLPEGRLLLHDLIEHATQPEFVHRHAWRVGDLVIWDNRATMHRARPFDDGKYRRELRRVTTLDLELPVLAAVGS